MTTIRANCPHCGDVQLRATDLTVRITSGVEHGSYTFICPSCERAVAKDASKRIIDLLMSTGVDVQVVKPPAELNETHVGPAIDADDILDFHLLLQDDSWFDELTHNTRSAAQDGEIQ
ncbi:MAG TPA: hypothetical protein PKB15_05705 [Acidimicrobiia bacterium]|nr:hypothetical protein [Acidimicrobiia bacterium]